LPLCHKLTVLGNLILSVLHTPSIVVAYHLAMNRILAATRYAVIVPAIASILGALLLMVQGSIEMIQVIIDAATNSTKLKITIVDVLTAVDAILLGTVLLVIGYGLYELFIDEDLNVPVWLQVHDLDDLKSKLIGVVVAIIAVIFVGVFVDINRADDVLAFGVGAGALVTGLAIFAFATKKDPATKVSRKDFGNKNPK
jgi:uncharacterized membrane protein YqhA